DSELALGAATGSRLAAHHVALDDAPGEGAHAARREAAAELCGAAVDGDGRPSASGAPHLIAVGFHLRFSLRADHGAASGRGPSLTGCRGRSDAGDGAFNEPGSPFSRRSTPPGAP